VLSKKVTGSLLSALDEYGREVEALLLTSRDIHEIEHTDTLL